MKRLMIRRAADRTGTITIEAALASVIMIGVFLFSISLFQLAIARNTLELSLIKTAHMMCRWAPIYKNRILEETESDLLANLQQELHLDVSSDTAGFLNRILNLRGAADTVLNDICCLAGQELCKTYIAEDPLIQNNILVMEKINLYRSSFFQNGGSQIRIIGTCDVKTYLPFSLNIGFSVSCRAWGRGDLPALAPDEQTSSIWGENNFTRGKILRQMYGGNLPENFPVISAFQDGTAILIKSLNHTAPSYQNPAEIHKAVQGMIDALYQFQGAEYGGISIGSKDILRRKLILILPENELDPRQEAALMDVMRYSMSRFVEVDLQRYQKV